MELLGPSEVPPAARRRLWIDLAIFTAISFGITWLLVGAYIWNGPEATRWLGPMKLGGPAFYAAVCAPSLAGVLVTALRYRGRGLADLVRSIFRLRVNWLWAAIGLLGYPLLWLVVALVRAVAGGGLAHFDLSPWIVALPALLLGGHVLHDPGALGEEIGWRGFALPRLLQLMDARAAAVALGLVWAVWHLPAFFISSLSQSRVDFGLFVVNVVAFSAFMTWLFVHTRGSVFWAGIVPHMMFNATPKAGITLVVWIAVLAGVVILALGRKTLRGFGRPAGVIPQADLLVKGADRA